MCQMKKEDKSFVTKSIIVWNLHFRNIKKKNVKKKILRSVHRSSKKVQSA